MAILRFDVVRLIDFNGNFGQYMAIMAGFEASRGEIVVTLDADLQNPPEEIPRIVAAIDEGHNVVGTVLVRKISLSPIETVTKMSGVFIQKSKYPSLASLKVPLTTFSLPLTPP